MSNFRRPKQWKSLRRVFGQPRHRRAASRRFQGEGLENRVLLAADLAAPFQNATDKYDVNHDGAHTLGDALNVVSSLRQFGPRPLVVPLASNGPHAGEGEGGMSIDVNGDNFLSVGDALEVVTKLRAEAEDESVSTPEDTSIFIDVLANDSGADHSLPNGGTARIVSVSQPMDTTSSVVRGSIVGTTPPSGGFAPIALTYVPPANYSGQVQFSYTWFDDKGDSEPANDTGGTSTVTVNVTEVNDDPTALLDSFTEPSGDPILQGETRLLDVLANDSVAPDNPALEDLTLTSVSQPNVGATVSIVNNQIQIVSDPHYFNYNSATFDFISYTISDGRGGTATGLVRYEIVPIEQAVQVRVEAVDRVTGQPITGPISTGTEFDLRVYAQDIRDPSYSDSGLAQVTFDILFNNSDSSLEERLSVLAADPMANPHGFSIDVEFSPEFRGLVSAPGIEPNKIDGLESVWTDYLSVTEPPLGPGEFLVATIGLRADLAGTVNLNGDFPDGIGEDTSFIEPGLINVFLPGGSGTLADGTTPIINFVNDSITIVAPVQANDDTRTVLEDSGTTQLTVVGNDTVTAGGNIALQSVSAGDQGGTLSVGTLNRISYTPAADFNGTETFTYTIIDGRGNSSTATVSVAVTSVNDEPNLTIGGNQTVNEDSGAITVTNFASEISAGAADEVGQTLTLSVTNNNNPLFSVQPAINQTTGDLSFTPAANANGTATVTVTLSDNGGTANGGDNSITRTFNIIVNSVNDAPAFAGVSGNTQTIDEDAGPQTVGGFASSISTGAANENQTLTFNVSSNNSGLFSVAPAVSPTGVLTYTPAANASGTATVTVTLMDNGGTANGGVNTSISQMFDIVINPINDPPTFNLAGNQSVNEDAGAQSVANFASSISAGAANESGQTLTFDVSATNPSLFSVAPAISSNGTLTYTPTANANGTSTVTVTLSDNGGGDDTSAEQTFTISVNAVNDPPVLVADLGLQVIAGEETELRVLDNDTDIDGDTLSIAAITSTSANGTVEISGTGDSIVFTPNVTFIGFETITYTVTDGTVTLPASVTVEVLPASLPIARSDMATAIEGNGSIEIDVLSNDLKNEGADFTINSVFGTPSNGGTVSLHPDGDRVIYTPAEDFFGTETFTYSITDGVADGDGVDTATATVTVTVTGVNDAPSFAGVDNNDQEVDEDAGAQVVAGFAADITAGPNEAAQVLTFDVEVSDPSLFSVQPTIDPLTGNLTYTPAADVSGTATVTVTLSDNGGVALGGEDTSASQSFEIVINPVNDAPSFNLGGTQTVAEDSGAATFAGFASNISAGPDDESGQVLSFEVDNNNTALFSVQPSIDPITGNLTFTTAIDANGSATVSVTLSDDDGGLDTSATQMFTINVTAVNDVPVAVDDSLSASEADPALTDAQNTTLLLPLVNDSDVDGDDLTIVAVGSGSQGSAITIAPGGQGIQYRPQLDVFNVTDTFTYTITDGNGETSTATIDLFIVPLSLPRARDDMATVEEDSVSNAIDVLDNDRKNDNGTFEITAIGSTSHGGTVVVNDNGTPGDTNDDFLDYTPAADFFGTETFTYTIIDNFDDGDGVTSSTGTVTVVVNNVNDAPTAVDDTAAVAEDSASNVINVLGNDLFAPDPQETLTIDSVSLVSVNSGNGIVDPGTMADQDTHLEYTPAADFFGSVTYSYTITDGNGGTDTATVTITVENANDNPTAVADTFTGVVEDSLLADNLLDVLANDQITPDVGETLTITAVGSISNGGTVSIEGGTALRYQPAADFFGTETFSYTISDGNGGTSMATVSVRVNNVNDDPTAVDDFFERILQTSSDNELDVLANDTFAPDDQNGNVEDLTITGLGAGNDATITTANGSTVEIAPDGKSVIFSPNGSFEGIDSFTYTISDGEGGVDTATVQVEVINFLFGSFSGYVYDDMNADGDRDAGERGYGSVEVHLTGTDFTGAAVDVTVETDSAGRYEFTSVVPGEYEVQIDQPAFTLPGNYDSDTGDATVAIDGQGQASFVFNFDILDGPAATENNFRLAGFDPGQVNSVWDLLASSSGSQAIAIVNTNGSEGEYFTLRSGWEAMQSVSVELVDSDTVLLHVTDSLGAMHTYEIPAIRTAPGGPYFRILAEDTASGMVAIRIIATPGQFGL